ncbi:MAG TPA: FtsQ-type POTRA domain-containing protein [Acidimicrobiales bacterium]|nr:FtsQ-type POTRA domain-containing protein [Acidimicrobiales bacterium]
MSGDGATEEGRRSLWWAWTLLVVVVVGAGGFAATRSSLLDVDRVEVVGVAGYLTSAQILDVAAVRLGDPMVKVDTDAVDRRITSEPWVEAVEVVREWPGSVRMSVLQRTAAVNAVDLVGRRALLDGSGTVLDAVVEPDADLTTVRVDALGQPGTVVPGVDLLLRAAADVTPDLGNWIEALVATGDGVRAELVGGVDAELGVGDDYRDEMRSLATVLTWVVLACLVTIDVSIHHNPVLVRDEARC